jgi:heparanase
MSVRPAPPIRTRPITAVLLFIACISPQLRAQTVQLDPAKMPRIGSVDERFQSYNIEMVEVIGGRFWKPYSSRNFGSTRHRSSQQESTSIPNGMNPNMYEYRPPIDLASIRLRKLAAALSPAYVRVSGTWANSVFFANSDRPPTKAPPGYSGVLTRREWKGVIDFSHTVNAPIVTSFTTSAGSCNADGVWTPKESSEWTAYTSSVGGSIAAAEFMNEPTYAALGGAPKGYNAADYARDIKVFGPWLKKNSPSTIFLGPGSVGEGPFAISLGDTLNTADLLQATGPAFGIFSYHLYAAASERCASVGEQSQTTASAALSEEWLSRPEKINEYYASLRDRFEPGKSLWITETADAACGGNPWASTFLDTFRYVIEHASLARRGVKVIMHNTLASSDYGLLDQNTFEPRPNYWAALLWRKLMGTTVLDPKVAPAQNTYVYAHCLREHPGGVALLVINADQQRTFNFLVPFESQRYTITGSELGSRSVQLNGRTLALENNNLPRLTGKATRSGQISFGPTSITFLEITSAGNGNCQ